MPKIISVDSHFEHREQKNSNVFSSVWGWFSSLDKFYRFSFITMLLILVGVPIMTTQHFNFFEYASTNKTAIISASPNNGNYPIGQPFIINIIVDGGGQTFNAAQANIAVSSNLSVQAVTVPTPSAGGCGFTFVNAQKTPSLTNLNFAGAILNGSSPSCIVYSLTLLPTLTGGTGTVTISNGSVKSYANSSEILSSMQSGSYGLGISPTSTPTPTATPAPQPTPTPTSSPVLPTPTPTPTISPLQAPTIDVVPTDTYQTTLVLTGTKSLDTTAVYVNNATTSVTYPTTTTWQYPTTLVLGANPFTVYGQNTTGAQSSTTSITITLHRLGDINGDGVIDLTDLSMFGTDYENTGTLNYALSDMNGDGVVDLTDFSIIARAYGN